MLKRTMNKSVQSVDDVIRAITGQSPRQSVDEIIGAVTELLEVELGWNPNGNRSLGGVRRWIQPTHRRALGWAIMNSTQEFQRLGLQLQADTRRLRSLPSDERVSLINLGET